MKYILLPLVILSSFFCSKQEIFIDDKGNWERVFGRNKQYNIDVIKSYVWKSSDYCEIEFYFKIKYNKNFFYDEIKNLKQINYSDLNYSRFKQKWFAPNPSEDYIVYMHNKNKDLNTILIYDTKESVLYYHDIYW